MTPLRDSGNSRIRARKCNITSLIDLRDGGDPLAIVRPGHHEDKIRQDAL